MSLTGGKRKVNKGLKDWVTFVKKVQKEENLSYKDAIHRAKQRKDKGEKWMTGGNSSVMGMDKDNNMDMGKDNNMDMGKDNNMDMGISRGGRRRRRTMRRTRGRGRGRTVRRSRGRASRRA